MKKKPNRYYIAGLISIASFIVYSDQQLLNANLSAAAKDLGISEDDKDSALGGWPTFWCSLVAAATSFSIAMFSHRINLVVSFLFFFSIGEIFCLLTFFTKSYTFMLICRAGTGLALGAVFPISFTFFAELFNEEERVTVSALYSLTLMCSKAFGDALAGYLGSSFGWRMPYLVVGICAILAGFFLVANLRNFQLQEDRDQTTCSSFKDVFSIPSNVVFFLQTIPLNVATSVLGIFLIDYLHVNRGLSVKAGTTLVMFLYVGVAIGGVSSAVFGQMIYKKSVTLLLSIMVSTTFLTTILGLTLLHLKIPNPLPWYYYCISIFVGAFSTIFISLQNGILMNVTPSNLRTPLFALTVVNYYAEKGIGPLLTSSIVSALGREKGFSLAMMGGFLSAMIASIWIWTVPADIQRNKFKYEEVENSIQLTSEGMNT